MLIIVEGGTCTGKSTLIEALKERIYVDNLEFLHKDRPEELTRRWVLNDYVLGLEKAYRPGHNNVIADRWHWGERTYAPVYRPDTNTDGYGLLGQAGWRWVEMFLASRGALIAHLTAESEVLVKRFTERGDDHVTNEEELLRIASLYELARRDSLVVGAIHDTGTSTEDLYESFVESIISEAQVREQAVQELVERWPQYVGVPNPGVLLVGERRNVTKTHGDETHLTFMPVNGNSGEFLLNSLHDMFWRQVGMVNGTEIDNMAELWVKLGQPRIIALGRRAALSVANAGFEEDSFVTLPHPQYVRRFFHGKSKEYGDAIRRATETGEVDIEWTL